MHLLGAEGSGAGLSRGALNAVHVDGTLPLRSDEEARRVRRMGERESSNAVTSVDLALVKAGRGVFMWPRCLCCWLCSVLYPLVWVLPHLHDALRGEGGSTLCELGVACCGGATGFVLLLELIISCWVAASNILKSFSVPCSVVPAVTLFSGQSQDVCHFIAK